MDFIEKNKQNYLEDTWACSKNRCDEDNTPSFFWLEQEKNKSNVNVLNRQFAINTKDFEREKHHFQNCKIEKRKGPDLSVLQTIPPKMLPNDNITQQQEYDDEITEATMSIEKALRNNRQRRENAIKDRNITNYLDRIAELDESEPTMTPENFY